MFYGKHRMGFCGAVHSSSKGHTIRDRELSRSYHVPIIPGSGHSTPTTKPWENEKQNAQRTNGWLSTAYLLKEPNKQSKR